MTDVPQNSTGSAPGSASEENPAPTPPPVALTIAGFDPSSGAGITADLKTFAAHGVFGVSCITAVTVQSTQGVRRVVPVAPELLADTLSCLADDIEIAGIKIGMLATGAIATAVGDFLSRSRVPRKHIVLDPILQSSSGTSLLDQEGVYVMRKRLLGQVGWITPNLDELAILIDHTAITRETIPGAAHHLRGLAHMAGNEELSMVITGGHLDRPDDYFLGPSRNNREPALHNMDGKDEGLWIPGEAVKTTSTHGTGCAFSSALLAALLHGQQGMGAVVEAKQFVTGALRAAYPVGKGHGPMDHFYRQRPSQSLQV